MHESPSIKKEVQKFAAWIWNCDAMLIVDCPAMWFPQVIDAAMQILLFIFKHLETCCTKNICLICITIITITIIIYILLQHIVMNGEYAIMKKHEPMD